MHGSKSIIKLFLENCPTKTNLKESLRLTKMSNLFGIIKKKTDYKLPSLKVSLKDVYSDNTSLFHFEETFDISKYEDEEFFIIISGFISNLKTICPNYVSESNNHAEIIANIYNQDTKKFQEKLYR